MQVWKYQLKLEDEQLVEIPGIYESLCVKLQHGNPCLWALVDPEQPKKKVKIYCVGTGHATKFRMEDVIYIGTILINNEYIVLHFFEEM